MNEFAQKSCSPQLAFHPFIIIDSSDQIIILPYYLFISFPSMIRFSTVPCDLHSAHLGPSVVTWTLIPYVVYPLYLNAITCENCKFFNSLLLQKESILLVLDETCSIQFNKVNLYTWKNSHSMTYISSPRQKINHEKYIPFSTTYGLE